MKWLQAIHQRFPKHKYAVNAKQLGDDAECAWSNLGYWNNTSSYPEACCQLADQLAQAISLNSQDHLLDLGCGQGASLLHWQQHYHIQYLAAVELQKQCVDHIQEHIQNLEAIYCQSFLNLTIIPSSKKFDAVLCIDAAYHSPLNLFLDSVSCVLSVQGRLGFHYLIWSEKWKDSSLLQKQQYRWLLKSADVHLENLLDEEQLKMMLKQHAFIDMEVQDFSEPVLHGFSNYFDSILKAQKMKHDLDYFKIQMTAKLCKKLYQDGLVRYVQITARLNE